MQPTNFVNRPLWSWNSERKPTTCYNSQTTNIIRKRWTSNERRTLNKSRYSSRYWLNLIKYVTWNPLSRSETSMFGECYENSVFRRVVRSYSWSYRSVLYFFMIIVTPALCTNQLNNALKYFKWLSRLKYLTAALMKFYRETLKIKYVFLKSPH